MKHIIVPTDFSENAFNALNYAIHLANHYDLCTIHLIHVYDTLGEIGMTVNATSFVKDQVERDLSTLVQEAKPSLFHGTTLVAKAISGLPADTIIEYASYLEADYIIMGTKGASGLKGIFLGSNTLGVINHSNIPVLAIPSGFKYRAIKQVALAIDSEIVSTADVVEPVVRLAKKYQSEIKVLHVGKTKELATIDAGVDIYLSDLKHSFYFVQNKNISEGIDDFVEQQAIDLLCMIRRERSFFSKLFHSSITRKEAYGSRVPLLVLYDK